VFLKDIQTLIHPVVNPAGNFTKHLLILMNLASRRQRLFERNYCKGSVLNLRNEEAHWQK